MTDTTPLPVALDRRGGATRICGLGFVVFNSVPRDATFASLCFPAGALPVAWHHLPARQPDSSLLCAFVIDH